ncbi:MAG: hypothetical protein L0L60_08085 [Tetragenococcus halophilus]|uniref:hypothetical protein n=1 Tax=Staphylococcus cohnii TaxID=29382 RepID=UPI001F22A840|nr:hypothetical protein [Staphylococcus cohnii]MCE5034970.1 hypothetical protein [Staphylococcus cohnii]MDN6840438.1 hypothetical protein [Tetragenococcus halophilus]MDN6850637.1 hypothetical protein [Staphylococcus equorum]
MSHTIERTFNHENFFASLTKRHKPQKETKVLTVEDRIIKNVPVLKDNRDFEDSVSVDTLTEIYKLIDSNPHKKIIYFK